MATSLSDRAITVSGRADVERAVHDLPRGQWLRLSADDGDHWAQAYLRENGLFLVEHAAPGEHREAFTASRHRLADALADWADGGGDWRGAFDWTAVRPPTSAAG